MLARWSAATIKRKGRRVHQPAYGFWRSVNLWNTPAPDPWPHFPLPLLLMRTLDGAVYHQILFVPVVSCGPAGIIRLARNKGAILDHCASFNSYCFAAIKASVLNL